MTEQVSRLFEEERLHRKMAESLGQTALALNSSLDLQEVIGKILTLLRQVVPFYSAGLFLHNDDHLVLTTGIGLDPLLFGYRLPLDSPNQTVQVFNRREPVVLGDVRQDPHWEALPPVGHLIRSWMAAPLLLGSATG